MPLDGLHTLSNFYGQLILQSENAIELQADDPDSFVTLGCTIQVWSDVMGGKLEPRQGLIVRYEGEGAASLLERLKHLPKFKDGLRPLAEPPQQEAAR